LLVVLVVCSVIADAHAGEAAVYGALLGANIGPNIVPFGSLATMLVLGVARKKGQPVSGASLLKVGIWMTPLVLLAAVGTLALTFAFRR
jgi:arsenical pump membrane protein